MSVTTILPPWMKSGHQGYAIPTDLSGIAQVSVLAIALRQETPRQEAIQTASRWLDLLRGEFFPPASPEREARLSSALDFVQERGWVLQDAEARIEPTPEGRIWLGFFSEQVRPVLETYAALFAAARIEEPTKREKLIQDAQHALEDQLLLGEARCSEAVCPTTLGNALRLLLEDGVLVVEGNARASDALYSPGPDHERLGELSDRLARTLRTR